MHRYLARFTSAAAIAAIVAAPLRGVAGGDPTTAATPAPITIGAPSQPTSDTPKPTSYAMRAVVEPLREIGHVKAVTPFCKKFLTSAAPAVNSALAYEGQLMQTLADFRRARLSDELSRFKSLRVLEADLRRLHDFAKEGRAELAGITELAKDSDEEPGTDLIAFRDALDGAKARQMDLISRVLSRNVARYAEQPIYALASNPGDGTSARNAFGRSSATSILDFSGNDTSGQANPNAPGAASLPESFDPDAAAAAASPILSNQSNLFAAVVGDEFVERDLADAARHGKAVIDLEHC
jgi:hypothetical protein